MEIEVPHLTFLRHLNYNEKNVRFCRLKIASEISKKEKLRKRGNARRKIRKKLENVVEIGKHVFN